MSRFISAFILEARTWHCTALEHFRVFYIITPPRIGRLKRGGGWGFMLGRWVAKFKLIARLLAKAAL
jgi:hypothetical protein